MNELSGNSGQLTQSRGEVVGRLVHKWDMLVYRLAYRSLDRLMRRGSGGFAYLFELQLRQWRECNPLSPEMESATEKFHETLMEAKARKSLGAGE
jgi:hypothetical protein